MKRVLIAGLLACSLISPLFSVPTNASASSSLSEIDFKEIKQANLEYLEQNQGNKRIAQNKSNQIEEVREKYKEKFANNPELEKEFINTIQALKQENLDKAMENVPTDEEGTFQTVFDDGSAISITIETTKVVDSASEDLATAQQTYTTAYMDFDHNYKINFTHVLYPDTTLGLQSRLYIGSTEIVVNSVNDYGTWAMLPFVTVASSTSVADNSSKSQYDPARTEGSYVVTFAGYDGVGLATFRFYLHSKIMYGTPSMYGLAWSTEDTNN